MNEYKPDYENMKYGLTILLLLLSIVVHGQIQQLVIMDNQGNDECAIQAFIVQGNKTFIDRCYIGIDDDFEDLKEIPSEPIFNKLLQLDIQEFYRLSGDINYQAYNKPCDAILPIAFVIGDKIIEWKRIDNCYPESAKNYAEGIIKVFEKY